MPNANAELFSDNKVRLDVSSFPQAIRSGNPLPLSELIEGQTPEAIRCQPVWKEFAKLLSEHLNEPVRLNQDITLKISRYKNDFHQTLSEYNYENESTGESWQEYYVEDLLVFQDTPQSVHSSFSAQWIGKSLLLFRAEQGAGFFFLVDTDFRIIRLFHDSQWKQIPMNLDPITSDIWQYNDPSMPVKLAGFEEHTGQLFFYVVHEYTTLFEYNPLWPNNVTVLFEHLPAQDAEYSNYYTGQIQLWQREDGSIWFCTAVGGEPGQSGLVFRYNGKTKVLTPVFKYSDRQHCYFYKEAIAIHDKVKDNILIFQYNANAVFKLEDCSGMYVNTDIGPNLRECFITYSEMRKTHVLWDLSENKRYDIAYEDMVRNFPVADSMAEWDEIAYLHGAGGFYVYNSKDDKYGYDGYFIDWYSSIHHP